MKRRNAALVMGLSFATLAPAATITPIAPFIGTMSETWETFATGYYGTTMTIMEGDAQVVDTWQIIVTRGISMGSSGLARPTDGVQLAYIQGTPSTTITFQDPVRRFGAYWGGHTGLGHPDPQVVGLVFKDAGGNTIESITYQYSHAVTGDGLLDWHGWSSSVGIKTIVINHSLQIFVDGLRASRSAPDPGSSLFFLSGALVAVGWVARRFRE